MKLIMTAAVDNLGVAGDVVEVKDGYGRNYLVPRGYAIRWTRGGEKQIDGIKRDIELGQKQVARDAERLAQAAYESSPLVSEPPTTRIDRAARSTLAPSGPSRVTIADESALSAVPSRWRMRPPGSKIN